MPPNVCSRGLAAFASPLSLSPSDTRPRRVEKVLPFSLMLFMASSMSHVEAAVTQVAYRNAKYLWPGFAGATRPYLSSWSFELGTT